MVSIRSLALLAAATIVSAQEFSTLEPCAQTCYNNALGAFATYNCGAGDVACMCRDPNWSFSIRDCAQNACDPAYVPTVTAAASALCATATVPPPAAATTSGPPTTTPTPPATTPPPEPTPSTSSSSSSHSSTPAAESTAAKLTSSSATSSPTSSATKAAFTSHSSTASHVPAATTSSAAAPVGLPSQGMTTSTKIGVGVGVTVAVAALIGAVVFFLLRRRNRRNIPAGPKHWKISEPMSPGSGRTYTQDYNHSFETGLSELEMKSRRYEDMVPRQTPRHMV